MFRYLLKKKAENVANNDKEDVGFKEVTRRKRKGTGGKWVKAIRFSCR